MVIFPSLPDLELKKKYEQLKNRFLHGCIRFRLPPIPRCEAYTLYDGKPITGAALVNAQYVAAYTVAKGESIDSLASAMQAQNDPFKDICPWFFDASALENSGLPSGISRPWEFLAYFNYGSILSPELNWLLCLACGFDARANLTRDKKNYLYKGGEVLYYPTKVKNISPLHLRITKPALKIRLNIEVPARGLPRNTGRTAARVHMAEAPNPILPDFETDNLREIFDTRSIPLPDCNPDPNGILFTEVENMSTAHTLYRLSPMKTHVYDVTAFPTPGAQIMLNPNPRPTEQQYLQIILFKDGKPVIKGSQFNSLADILKDGLPIFPKLVRIVVNVYSACTSIKDLVIDNTVIYRDGKQLVTLR
jgi:hypothetical protein